MQELSNGYPFTATNTGEGNSRNSKTGENIPGIALASISSYFIALIRYNIQ
jgi:hypothetical protein